LNSPENSEFLFSHRSQPLAGNAYLEATLVPSLWLGMIILRLCLKDTFLSSGTPGARNPVPSPLVPSLWLVTNIWRLCLPNAFLSQRNAGSKKPGFISGPEFFSLRI